jgi:hypothetical protein
VGKVQGSDVDVDLALEDAAAFVGAGAGGEALAGCS